MRRRDQISALGRVVDLRNALELSAEMRSLEATAKQHERARFCEQLDEDLSATRRGWSTVLESPPMNLPLASAWSVAVLSGADHLAAANERLNEARRQSEAANRRLQVARAQAHVAVKAHLGAVRKREKERAEAALNDIADQFAYRGSSL